MFFNPNGKGQQGEVVAGSKSQQVVKRGKEAAVDSQRDSVWLDSGQMGGRQSCLGEETEWRWRLEGREGSSSGEEPRAQVIDWGGPAGATEAGPEREARGGGGPG